MKNKSILFIGTFLSHIRGTYGVSQQIAEYLEKEGYFCNLTSRYENRLFRIFDMIVQTLRWTGKVIHIDVYSGNAFMWTYFCGNLAQWKRKKTILTLHGGKLPEFSTTNFSKIDSVFKRVQRIQTPSLYIQSFFINKGFNVHYLPNPINLNLFPFNRDKVKPFTLLWVRAFTEIYKPDLAIRTLFEVRKEYPEATLTMVGPDKGLLRETKTLIQALKLEPAVTIAGPVPNESLKEFYHSHSVYLNTTTYESFGVAVMEAAACGIPIVSTKVGEIPLLWKEEEEMIMVGDFDEKPMAMAVCRILSEPELAHQLSRNARKKAEQFSWEKIKPQWLELLKSKEA